MITCGEYEPSWWWRQRAVFSGVTLVQSNRESKSWPVASITSGVMTLPMKRMDPANPPPTPQKQVKKSWYTGSHAYVTWHTPALRSLMTKKKGWSAITCGYSTRVRVRAIRPDRNKTRCVQSPENRTCKPLFVYAFFWVYLSQRLPPNPPRSPPGKPSELPSRCTGLYQLTDTISSL